MEELRGQEEVFRFLADPAAYGGMGGADGKVQRIDTHAASVFLAGKRALKLKRAVRFPFLDYSTLTKRKEACQNELAVNLPYAPEIYRGVVAITREPNGGLAIGGKGTPVEWVVEMYRFDETRTLDRLADQIDDSLADALGRAVASAHAKAPVIDAAPWIEALNTYLDQNLVAFQERPEIFEPQSVAALDRQCRDAYARILLLLRTRGGMGRVRRCHGDLHLGNVVLLDGRPVLFDAIEFDPLIAAGDVLYDLSFLLMDLCERNRIDAANIVLNRYLTETQCVEDLDGLAALPLFLSLRAAIRAKVIAARIDRVENDKHLAQSAHAYFDWSRRAITPPPPQLIAVGGLSGTGKTHLARKLAPHLPPMPGAVVVRSDVERKVLFGVAEIERLSESAYTPDVSARVYAKLGEKARRVLAAGHSIVLDAVFAHNYERDMVAALKDSLAVHFRGLFLAAPLETRIRRLGRRVHDASDADQAIAQAQEGRDLGKINWTPIDASGSPRETLARALATLRR